MLNMNKRNLALGLNHADMLEIMERETEFVNQAREERVEELRLQRQMNS